jgi:predicted secreted Zn-dependent protease
MIPRSEPGLLLVAALLTYGCASATSPAAHEDPRVKAALKFNTSVTEQPIGVSYDVFGTTPAEVRASLAANLPKLDGRRVLGSHSYWISYSYKTRSRAFRCTADPRFIVQSTTVLPRWKDREQADSSLRAQWDVFMAALTRHENGHRAIAIRKVDLMQRRMASLEPTTCAELKPLIKNIFDDTMKEMASEQVAWDADPANRSAQFIPGARRPPP